MQVGAGPLELRELPRPSQTTEIAVVLVRCELYHLKRGATSGVLPLELVFKAAQGSGGQTRHISRLEHKLESLSAELTPDSPALAEQATPAFLQVVVELCYEQVR